MPFIPGTECTCVSMMTPCMFPIGAMHQLSESILAHLSQNWTLWRTSSMWKEITLQSDDGYNEHLVSNEIHLFLVSSYEILMTSSNGNIFRVTGSLCGKTSPSPHKGQLRGTLVFSLICAWINRWANNRNDGDLRRHRAHYDANVIYKGNQLAFVPCTKQYHKQKKTFEKFRLSYSFVERIFQQTGTIISYW